MAISHHPALESLISCSAGAMPEPFAAIMASHIQMCPTCQRELALMQDIGQTLFEGLCPVAVDRPAPVLALRGAEADVAEVQAADVAEHDAADPASDVPAPLRAVLGDSLDKISWRWIAPGVYAHRVALPHPERGTLRLMKVAPGRAIPDHGHVGSEITLVLRGAFHDASGTYRAGDVADMAETDNHAPVADATAGCICLIATDGSMMFKSKLARLMKPLTGF